MKNELKDILHEVYSNMPVWTPKIEGIIIKSIQAAYDMAKSDEWVSVTDRRKPKDDQWVHCAALMSNGEYDVLLPSYSYSEKYDTYTGYGEAQQDGRVTHWRPLPTPPNQ